MLDLTPEKEKTVIVGVGLKNDDPRLMQGNMDELALLAETAGAQVVGVTSQRLEKITPSTFIGKGKVEEVARIKDETQATMVVIDTKLSGVQQRNLQQLIGCKVIDRSQLIIDIFAQRAHTREGKLQVELAQLKDQLPRLIGEAIAGLSKLAGGIGTRGPGETKLEMDRRRVKERIEQVTEELEAVRKSRALHRQRRQQSRVSTVALVGYTNSGKSTLLNQLTNAHVVAENKLFATLDPTTRKLYLPSGRQAVLTDTVGFINNLPTHLIEAFKATFEELQLADLVLHVHDSSHPAQMQHSETVTKLLHELGVTDESILHVYNKTDLKNDSFSRHRLNPFVAVSALTGEGVSQLTEAIEEKLRAKTFTTDLYIPNAESGILFKLARDGKILSQEQGEHVIHCRVELSEEALQRWSAYLH